MPRGDKSSYTSKQKRQAEHIEEGYERRGVGKKTAEARAWATVNKSTGGGKKKAAAKKKATGKKKAAAKTKKATGRKATSRGTRTTRTSSRKKK